MAKRELSKASGTSAGAIRTVPQTVGGMADFLKDNVKQIAESCGKVFDPATVIRLARTMFHKNPKLCECDPITILGGVIQSAAIGLELEELTGSAYLVPFWNSDRSLYEAQLIIGYRGLMRLARRSGEVTNIEAREVRVDDEFRVDLGTKSRIIHRPSSERPKGAAADGDEAFQAFYVVASIKGGDRPQFDYLWNWEVEAIRDAVKQKNRGKLSPAWRGHYGEMGKKSVVRRMSKYLPVSIEAQRAVTLDDLAANGMNQGLDVFVDREKLVAGSMPIPAEGVPRIEEDEGVGTNANNVAMSFEANLAETIDALMEGGADASEVVKTINRRKAAAMGEVANDSSAQEAIKEIAARYESKYKEVAGNG